MKRPVETADKRQKKEGRETEYQASKAAEKKKKTYQAPGEGYVYRRQKSEGGTWRDMPKK